MWTVHHYSVDHGQRKPSFNITLMQWPLKWPCFFSNPVDVVVPFRGVPPLRDTWLFVVFVVHIILFFIRKLFFSYVCAKVCLSLLTAIRPFFYVGTWLLPAASHGFGATGSGYLGQVQDIGRVKNIYLKTGYIYRNCLNIYL